VPLRSFGVLCDVVETYTGVATPGAALAYVAAGYRRVLDGLDPRDAHVHVWACLEPIAELSLPANVTGTATGVYSAPLVQTTITATTAIFIPSQVGQAITVTDGGGAGVHLVLQIASYTSPTVIVATGGNAFAGKAVSLPHHGVYDLPAAFNGLVKGPVYPYSALDLDNFQEVSPQDIFAEWQSGQTQGTPCKYAIAAKAELSTQAAQGWAIIVAPKPDVDRLIRYRYRVDTGALVPLDDSAKYPIGGPHMDQVYEMAGLADAEARLTKSAGMWEARYQQTMAAAIDADRALFQTDGPARMQEG